jgi:hypothetical protein
MTITSAAKSPAGVWDAVVSGLGLPAVSPASSDLGGWLMRGSTRRLERQLRPVVAWCLESGRVA